MQQFEQKGSDLAAELSRLESKFEKLASSFEREKQKFFDELRELRQRISNGGLNCIADILQRTLRLASAEPDRPKEDTDRLREVRQRLQNPLESSLLAWAYAELRSIVKDSDHCKRAQRTLRDLFVLTTTTQSAWSGPWNNDLLEKEMADAFARGCNWPKMENKEMSQLVLAFNKILVLGKSREGFSEKVRSEGMYGPELTDDEVENLFRAFSDCALKSPHYVSKKVATGRARTKGHKAATAAAASGDMDAPQMDPWTAVYPGAMYTLPQGQVPGPPEEPPPGLDSQSALYQQPSWKVTNRNTFINVEEDRDDARSHLSFATFPPNPQRCGPTYHQYMVYEDFEQLKGSFAPASHICQRCQCEDSNGWRQKSTGDYFCQECYYRRKYDKSEASGSAPLVVPRPSVLMELDGEDNVDFIESPEPLKGRGYEKTPCVIDERDCLEVAREAVERNPPNRVGLLVCGREGGPRDPHDKDGQSKDVLNNSNLFDIVEKAEGGPTSVKKAVPRMGGIYVPQVTVTRGEPPFTVNMLYAASARDPGGAAQSAEEAQKQMRQEMLMKVRNVLRIFHERGNDELVLGAWGCGWRGLEANVVAQLFYTALKEDSETCRRFRQVTFAIRGKQEQVVAFQKVFQPELFRD